MARYLAQLIIAGTQVIGRAFARAIKQEIEASQQAAQRLGQTTKTRTERMANNKLGLTLDEAKQILNINDINNQDELNKRYELLFKANDKTNGGSFYIQSKVVRAKERIDYELKQSRKQQDVDGNDNNSDKGTIKQQKTEKT